MDILVSKLCSLMGIFALLQTFIPPPLRIWLESTLGTLWEKLFQPADPYVYMEVEEKSGGHNYNAFYREVGAYLSSLRSSLDMQTRLKVFRPEKGGSYVFSLPYDEPLETTFQGVRVWWTLTCTKKEGGKLEGRGGMGCGGLMNPMTNSEAEEKSYTLKFLKSERHLILPAYMDHISNIAVQIEHSNSQRQLFTNNFGEWEGTPINHHASFDTLALDGSLANRIKADLDTFVKGEEYFHKNGRAWKRGYLLYGPPGTGKSSMIVAIANYLKFDIYDFELTKVFDNAELKSLLIRTTRKSIIVIEDIDCTVPLPDRPLVDESLDVGAPADAFNVDPSNGGSKLTLSGLLNFTDGLWSCCGEERIFIFTTNNKEKLDPALLRPGRMDMHILLSYCSFAVVKKLVSNYLGIQYHHMLTTLRQTIEGNPGHRVTPAAVAELLIINQKDPDAALKELVVAFHEESSADQNGADKEEKSSSDHLDDWQQEGSSPKKVRKGIRFLIFRIRSKNTD